MNGTEVSKLEQAVEQAGSWGISVLLDLLTAVVIILIGWWVTKLVIKAMKKIMRRSRVEESVVSFVSSVVKVILWIVILITALGQVVNISSMVAALGAAGLTASFALQGSLGNFISGMQIIFSKPYSIGDFLDVDGKTGTVSRIAVLDTRLITVDNKEIVIPNSKMTSTYVINYSSQKTRRLDLSYGISYDADIDLAKETVFKIAEADSRVMSEPVPTVYVGEHKDSSVEIVAKLWCSGSDYLELYYGMQEKVKKAFDEKGIVIPFPQLDVHTDK